jgi:glycosyltransferase involved in cell wall biosynthesis
MAREKLLFASEVFPHPLDRGDRVRIHHILAGCAREYDVTFIGPRPDDESQVKVPDSVRDAVLFDPQERLPGDFSLVVAALASRVGIPFGRSFARRIRFLRALRKLGPGKFDVIWAERPDIGLLFSAHRARTIVDYDDVTHRKLERQMRLQPSLLRRWETRYKAWVYRRAELTRFHGYRGIAVCSAEDRDYLESRGVGPVLVVPNGVNIQPQSNTRAAHTAGARLRAVFLGNMAHEANVDAVAFCVDEILPLASGAIASLDVIGANVSTDMERRYGDRVRFRGFVDNVSEALGEYDVMVAPIRFGSGTKLKLLEAMGAGLPLVTTTIGAEGLMVTDGVQGLIGDTATALTAALQRLARDPELGPTLAVRAHEHAVRNFSWIAIEREIGTHVRSGS